MISFVKRGDGVPRLHPRQVLLFSFVAMNDAEPPEPERSPRSGAQA